MALPQTPSQTIRLGATWLVSPTDDPTKQAGRFTKAAYAGGKIYIATLGADRLETKAGVTHVINSLVRIDPTTREWDSGWVVSFDLPASQCEIHDLATDGTLVYISGNFSSITINGVTSVRERIAVINGATGQITNHFNGWSIGGTVRTMLLEGNTLYFGGTFTGFSVNDGSGAFNRFRLAAANVSSTPCTVTSWAPSVTAGRVSELAVLHQTSPARTLIGVANDALATMGGASNVHFAVFTDLGSLVFADGPSPNASLVVDADDDLQAWFLGTKGSGATGGNTTWSYTGSGTPRWGAQGLLANGDNQALGIGKLSYGFTLLAVGTHDTNFAAQPGGGSNVVGSGFALYDANTGLIQSYMPGFTSTGASSPWTGSFLKVWEIQFIESLGWMIVGGDFTGATTTSGTAISPAPYRVAIYEDPDAGGEPPPPPSDTLAFRVLTSAGGNSASSFNTTTISPVGGRAVVVGVSAYRNDSVQPSAPTVTGANITFSLQGTSIYDDVAPNQGTLWVFAGLTASPGVGPLTINFGGQPIHAAVWDVVEVDGVPGSAYIRNVATNVDNTSPETSGTLPAFGSSDNRSLAFYAKNVSQSDLYTVEGGWTKLGNGFTSVSPSVTIEGGYSSTADIQTAWTQAIGTGRAGSIILELVDAGGGTPPPAGITVNEAGVSVNDSRYTVNGDLVGATPTQDVVFGAISLLSVKTPRVNRLTAVAMQKTTLLTVHQPLVFRGSNPPKAVGLPLIGLFTAYAPHTALEQNFPQTVALPKIPLLTVRTFRISTSVLGRVVGTATVTDEVNGFVGQRDSVVGTTERG